MTDALNDAISLLDPDYGVDFWSDQVMPLEVAPLLRTLGPAEWDALAARCRDKPAGWCRRLAQASALTDDEAAARPLVAMLKRPEPELGAAAAAALLAIDYQWTPGESLLADLQRHLASLPDARGDPIRGLLARLPT